MSSSTKRGRGRPQSPFRAIMPHVRCHQEEIDEWTDAAAREERTFSSWVRAQLNRAAEAAKKRRK